MRILVTGAAGFIGSHFVDYVLDKHFDDQLIGFDCLTYAGNMRNLELALPNNRFEFVKGDIRNQDEVDVVMRRVDAVVNFAAETHVDRSINSSSEFVSTNVMGTNVLLESALRNDIDLFHQISTDEVYGSVENGFSKEDDKLLPRSPYAASKAGADLLVEAFRITHGLNTRITRASNNYGTRQYPEKLIPLFIKKLLAGEKVPLYGDGKNIRDWLDVRDHVRAVDELIRTSTPYPVFNVGGDELLENREVAQVMLDQFGRNESSIEFVADRKGHDRRYAIDNSLIQSECGFSNRHSLKLSIGAIVNWYKEVS